jgi:hypothetical protein
MDFTLDGDTDSRKLMDDVSASPRWVCYARSTASIIGRLVVYLVFVSALTYLGAELGSRYADAKHVDDVPSGSSTSDSGESWWYVAGGGLAGLTVGVVGAAVAEVSLVRRHRKRRSSTCHGGRPQTRLWRGE